MALFTLIAPTVHGGGGGGVDDYATEEKVRGEAMKAIASVAEKGKIPSSWTEVQPASSSEKMGKKGFYEWTVIFKNPEIEDSAKQTLYVILNPAGQVLRVNYSGK